MTSTEIDKALTGILEKIEYYKFDGTQLGIFYALLKISGQLEEINDNVVNTEDSIRMLQR